MGLLDGSGPEELLDSILNRAARLLGVRSGYVYLGEPGDDAHHGRGGHRRHAPATSASGCRSTEGVGGKVFTTGQAARRRRLRRVRGRAPGLRGPGRRGRRRAAPRRRARRRRPRPRVGDDGAGLPPAGGRGAHAVRAAGLDRARERPAPGAGAVAPRPGDRPADARDAHPARRRRARGAARRATRPETAVRSCSSTSTGSRSSTRASATRPATASCARSASGSPTVLGPGRHGRAIRRGHVRRAPARLRLGRRDGLRRARRSSSSSRRSTSTAGPGSSAPAWASRSACRAARAPATCSRRPRSRSSARSATRPAASPCSIRSAAATPASASTSRRSSGRALERDELTVHYQPILDLRTLARRRASRRSPAGSTRRAGSCCRSTSSRSPRSPS